MIYRCLKLKMVYEKKTRLRPVDVETTRSNINNAARIINKPGARIKNFRWRQWMCREILLFCENQKKKTVNKMDENSNHVTWSPVSILSNPWKTTVIFYCPNVLVCTFTSSCPITNNSDFFVRILHGRIGFSFTQPWSYWKWIVFMEIVMSMWISTQVHWEKNIAAC